MFDINKKAVQSLTLEQLEETFGGDKIKGFPFKKVKKIWGEVNKTPKRTKSKEK